MELVTDIDGSAAPRLNDLVFSEKEAIDFHMRLINEVVRMLCAGIVHGDLSEFNVLLDSTGPVIIDLPQAVDAAANNNAVKLNYNQQSTRYFSLFLLCQENIYVSMSVFI